MGKKGHKKDKKKKMTKKEQKQMNHLKLMQGKKDHDIHQQVQPDQNKKAA